MASWNIPALINKISEDVPAIKALLTALFKWTDADTTDVPVGAKRLQDVAGGKQMQEYSGSAWASVGKLMHDVDMLDGKHASTAQTADTIPVRDANGTIPGNISGNAATASSAYGLDSGYTVPVANGGTGATTEAGARASLGADNASNISSGILDIAYGGTGSSTKNFVDLTENQNVGGTKTFSTSFTTSASPMLTTTNWSGISIADTTRGQASYKTLSQVLDKDGKRFASFDCSAATDGSRTLYFAMRNRADTGWITDLGMKELADGTVQTLAKTAPAAANDTQIATTAWVRSATGNTSLNAATSSACSGNAATATKIQRDPGAGTYVSAAEAGGALVNSTTAGFAAVWNAPTKNYRVACATYPSNSDIVYLAYSVTNANISSNTNTTNKTLSWDAGTGTLTANAFVGVFPANTRMLFQQSAAPTGWTKETGSGYNNTALRFVTGNVANYTSGYAFTTCMANGRTSTSVTQGGTISNATQGGSISKTTAGGTVGNKALSVAMLAAHTHTVPAAGGADGSGSKTLDGGTNDPTTTVKSSSVGSGSNHNHGFTGSEHGHTFTGSSHGHTFTGSSHSHQLHLNVNYIDCIIAAKA